MCMQDLWIQQYLEGVQYDVKMVETSGIVTGGNPRRWSFTAVSTSTGSPRLGFGSLPSANTQGFLASGLISNIFTRIQIGTLITKPVFYINATANTTINVIEVSLTLPLEEVLSRFNQQFRKDAGIEWQVPNPLLPPKISRG